MICHIFYNVTKNIFYFYKKYEIKIKITKEEIIKEIIKILEDNKDIIIMSDIDIPIYVNDLT
jgi:hypothetical protein